MNYKFIQPVSMQVNKEQFNYLKKELNKLGYEIFGDNEVTSRWNIICTNMNNQHNHCILLGYANKEEKNRYFIDHYNPELFLALAAMTDSEYYHLGEYYVNSKGIFFNLKDIKESLNTKEHYINEYDTRPATKDELIAGFTKKEEFVLPEKWYVKRNKYNSLVINEYLNKLINRASNPYYSNVNGYLNYPFNNDWDCYINRYPEPGYKEITFEQFKKYVLKTETMNKKIIGYKAPYDIYTETAYFKINRGDLLVKDSSPLYYKCVNWKVDECEKYLLAKEIVETWEPVYEEDKKLKIFTLDCKDGRFELEVSTDGILYRPDSAYLDTVELLNFVINANYSGQGYTLSAKGRSEVYKCQYSHIDLGCKKSVPISQLKEVVDYYNSIKL